MTEPEQKPPLPQGPLISFALVAFAADVLVYYFTIEPLKNWSVAKFGSPGWGILAQYGLRALSAAIAAAAMVHWRALSPRDLGLSFSPFRRDAAWAARLAGGLVVLSLVLMAIGVAILRI
ncbi:MAG TPA: hypothetical protein VJU16_02290, partial [Planctomycetota bacterium]|nr:hypothetical protein [Planctomycetota bacterium]